MHLAQILEHIWHWMNKAVLLLGLVGALLLLLLLTFLLPQAPVSPTNEAAFLRWLAETRASLGSSTSLLASSGLLSLRTSWWTRGVLALLAFVTVARGVRLVERWEHFTSYGRGFQIVIFIGALLLLVGWGVQLRVGWIETGVSAWPGETIVLSSHERTLAAPREAFLVARRGYGLYLLREDMGLGLDVTAEDEDGTLIPLRTSTQGDPQEHLRLTLSPRSPDAYFALPSSRLIFRVTLLSNPPEPQIRVQIYRGTGGELLTETTLQGGGTLFTDDLRVELEDISLPQLRVVYNPGAPLALVGGICLLLGTLIVVSIQAGWLPIQLQDETEIEDQEESSE